MGGFPALPSGNNPYVAHAAEAAHAAGSAYAAGIQFAHALRTAAAQQQAHQDMMRHQQMEDELRMREKGGTPMMLPGPATSSGLKRRDPDPQFAGPEHAGHMQTDTLGRAWHMPTEQEQAVQKVTPEQGYNGLMKALDEGGQTVSPEGNVHQMTTTPRFAMDPNGVMADTGASGVNVPVPDQSRVVTPPGSKQGIYMPTSDEKAQTKLHQDLAATAAKGENQDIFHTEDNDGTLHLFKVDKKTGRGEETGTFREAGKAKAEPKDKYSYTQETDDKGTVRTRRILNGEATAPPEFWNGKTKKWEADSGDNHFGKSKTEPFVIPGLGGKDGAGGPGAQLTGDEYLKTLPAGTAAQVKAMAEGRLTIPSASRSPAAIQLRSAVLQYDPSYSDQRAQVRKAFISGTDGQNLGKVNTAIVHLGRLGDTAEALQNGSFTPGNELFNYVKDKFGSATTTNFELLKDAVAGEMAAALKGNATDVEIAKMGKSIRKSNSPEQMRGVIGEGMAILADKANTADERYHAVLPDDPWSPILPTAKAQLAKHGVKRTGGSGQGGANPNPSGYVVNHVYGGMTYLGGDVNNAASWKKK